MYYDLPHLFIVLFVGATAVNAGVIAFLLSKFVQHRK